MYDHMKAAGKRRGKERRAAGTAWKTEMAAFIMQLKKADWIRGQITKS